MKSQGREGKDLGVEVEGEKSGERDPDRGHGRDIGGIKRSGDVAPVTETVRDGGGRDDTGTTAVPRVKTEAGGREED